MKDLAQIQFDNHLALAQAAAARPLDHEIAEALVENRRVIDPEVATNAEIAAGIRVSVGADRITVAPARRSGKGHHIRMMKEANDG